MIQRACLYVQNSTALVAMMEADPYLFEVASRFRLSIMLAEENQELLYKFGPNSVIQIHESWPLSMTFDPSMQNEAEAQRKLFITESSRQVWVQEIDAWFLLPAEHWQKIEYSSPHIYSFKSTADVKHL